MGRLRSHRKIKAIDPYNPHKRSAYVGTRRMPRGGEYTHSSCAVNVAGRAGMLGRPHQAGHRRFAARAHRALAGRDGPAQKAAEAPAAQGGDANTPRYGGGTRSRLLGRWSGSRLCARRGTCTRLTVAYPARDRAQRHDHSASDGSVRAARSVLPSARASERALTVSACTLATGSV